MPENIKLTQKRIGSVNSMKDVENAIRDLEGLCANIIQYIATIEASPAAGDIKVPLREEDGSLHLYDLVAGAGVTITPDTVNKTLTFTSP